MQSSVTNHNDIAQFIFNVTIGNETVNETAEAWILPPKPIEPTDIESFRLIETVNETAE